MNSQLTGKNPNSRKDLGQEEKRVTEHEMVGYFHQLNGHESEQTPGNSEGQEAWHVVIHGVAVRYGLVTEQQYVCVHIYNVHTYVYINNVTYVNNIYVKKLKMNMNI